MITLTLWGGVILWWQFGSHTQRVKESVTLVHAFCQVYAKLTGHKAGVTCLLALGSREAGGPDLLMSAAQDGSMALWDPSKTLPKGPDKEVYILCPISPRARVPSTPLGVSLVDQVVRHVALWPCRIVQC
jgi:hypothetical protein